MKQLISRPPFATPTTRARLVVASSNYPGEMPGNKGRKARRPGLFEVEDVSPPPQSLGIHHLPTNTHNGDQIDVDGKSYIVQKVVIRFKLIKGRYRQDHKLLEVHQTGRFLYNKFLENVYNLN